MDIRGKIECINCGETMKQGSTHSGNEIVQFRYCECGLRIILHTEHPDYEYSLKIDKKKK